MSDWRKADAQLGSLLIREGDPLLMDTQAETEGSVCVTLERDAAASITTTQFGQSSDGLNRLIFLEEALTGRSRRFARDGVRTARDVRTAQTEPCYY
ncbi:hypothetical protein FQA47_002500 [Oryzias melastigma]|uniref:Uncharacterized protein n=1 Tax=Oryzias melastigma TaxID=30732 RepID=A0A834FAE2_ORYME|nr:hypothetical protein FQA47_002500 [Oryzias melastigma]